MIACENEYLRFDDKVQGAKLEQLQISPKCGMRMDFCTVTTPMIFC